MQTLLQMTQDKIDIAAELYDKIIWQYQAGLITIHEFRNALVRINLVDSIPGVIDPITGLKHK